MNYEQDSLQVTINSSSIITSIAQESIKIRGDFQLELLKKAGPLFLSCESIETDDSRFIQIFTREQDLKTLSSLSGCTLVEKYLILIKIGAFFTEKKRRYTTFFQPDNIFFKDNYEVFFGFRGLPEMMHEEHTQNEFDRYKALVLSILQDKYSFEQLCDAGTDVLDDDEAFIEILETQTPEALHTYLNTIYQDLYRKSKTEVMGFPIKKVKVFLIASMAVFITLSSSLIYFIYRNKSETDAYMIRMNIYESHYSRHPDKVIEYAKKLKTTSSESTLNAVIADSMIAIGGKENFVEAFYLDASRQIECIEGLVSEEAFSEIANLKSDKSKVQMYQSFYARDYGRAIYIAENSMELRYDAQAQILLSRAYMNVGKFVEAIAIVDKLGDPGFQLEVYKLYREDVYQNETNISVRAEVIESLDRMIVLLEAYEKDEEGESA